MAKSQLEYEEEELRQLEKMYKADDITEETEEIVLKRARDTVGGAKFDVEYAQLNHDQTLKFALPAPGTTGQGIEPSGSLLDWEKNKVDLPLAPEEAAAGTGKAARAARAGRREAEEAAGRPRADDRQVADRRHRVLRQVRPRQVQRFAAAGRRAASPQRRRSSRTIVMTVVQPRPMFIRAAVPEDQLHQLRPGLKGIATPHGFPQLKLPTVVDAVSDVPTAPGSFDARLSVTLGAQGQVRSCPA